MQVTGPDGETHFPMRYYVCDEHYRNETGDKPGPIFFYLGNESNVRTLLPLQGEMQALFWLVRLRNICDIVGMLSMGQSEQSVQLLTATLEHVSAPLSQTYTVVYMSGVGCPLQSAGTLHTRPHQLVTATGAIVFLQVLLYLNATGLMWENAEKFGAMLIFAEHRYYGETLPFGKQTYKHMQWLTSEQALADYASLLFHFRRDNGIEDAPVIGFGGSYGGMLATWARLKYPFVRFHLQTPGAFGTDRVVQYNRSQASAHACSSPSSLAFVHRSLSCMLFIAQAASTHTALCCMHCQARNVSNILAGL